LPTATELAPLATELGPAAKASPLPEAFAWQAALVIRLGLATLPDAQDALADPTDKRLAQPTTAAALK
jgi:hypothetical protein